jgi:RNA polymerase sigma factor (sigma-70 family)
VRSASESSSPERSRTFDEFFDANFEALARWAALMVRDRAVGEEVAQDAMIRVFLAWDDLETPDHALNYAYKSALHLSGRITRRVAMHLRILPLLRDDRHDEAEGASVRMDALRALGRLSTKERATVLLVDFMGYPPGHAAEIVQLSAGATRVTLHRARGKLRRLLAERTG